MQTVDVEAQNLGNVKGFGGLVDDFRSMQHPLKWGIPVGVGLAALGYGTNQLQNMAAGDGLGEERNGWAQAASTLGNAALYGIGGAVLGQGLKGGGIADELIEDLPYTYGFAGALTGALNNNNDIRRKELQQEDAEVALQHNASSIPWYRYAGGLSGALAGAGTGYVTASIPSAFRDPLNKYTIPVRTAGALAGGLVGGYLFRPQKRDYAWGEMPETFQD